MKHPWCGGILPVLAAGVLCLAAPASAESRAAAVAQAIGHKCLRGTANLATGWVELVKQPYLVGKREGWVIGATRGPFDGLGLFVARTLGGAYEILTCPLPVPPGYQPLLEPEHVWRTEVNGVEP